jgi:hypothetical protein
LVETAQKGTFGRKMSGKRKRNDTDDVEAWKRQRMVFPNSDDALNNSYSRIQLEKPNNLPSPPSSDSKPEKEPEKEDLRREYSRANAILAQAHLQRVQRHPNEKSILSSNTIPHQGYDQVNSVLHQLHLQRRTGPEWREEDMDMSD